MPAPDPPLIPRLLALPPEFRRALWRAGGDGYWVHRDGVESFEERPSEMHARNLLEGGWAWWPADSAAWIRASGCLQVSRPTVLLMAILDGSAPEAALAHWEGQG